MVKYIVCSERLYTGEQLRIYQSDVTDLEIAKAARADLLQ